MHLQKKQIVEFSITFTSQYEKEAFDRFDKSELKTVLKNFVHA